MVIGTLNRSSKVQTELVKQPFENFQQYGVFNIEKSRLQETQKSDLNVYEFSNSVLRNTIDSDSQYSASESRRGRSSTNEIDFVNLKKYNQRCYDSTNKMNSQLIVSPNQQHSTFILDFESSPEILSQTKTNKVSEKMNETDDKNLNPVVIQKFSTLDKKKGNSKEESVLLPTGKFLEIYF